MPLVLLELFYVFCRAYSPYLKTPVIGSILYSFCFVRVQPLCRLYSQTSFSDRLTIKPQNNKRKVDLQIFPTLLLITSAFTKNEVVRHVSGVQPGWAPNEEL